MILMIVSYKSNVTLVTTLLLTQVGWSNDWTLGLKVLVPGLIGCALQFEFGYLHFEKTLEEKTLEPAIYPRKVHPL